VARVSFSQYSMWKSCPQQYRLNYIDELSQSTSNVSLIFGTAMHEVLQSYIDVCLRLSKSQADRSMNLKQLLTEKMRENYLKESEKCEEEICTKEELVEHLNDGILILEQFQKSKHFNKFFDLKYDEVIAIEQPLNTKVKDNINFIGFIDLVIKDSFNGKYRIIDFKTSTKGWSSYHKKDEVKNSQILIYKKFYSELFGVSQDMIDVEFIILKRKIPMDTEYPIPRISKHVPANGKPSINRAWDGFMEFINTVFDESGNRRTDIDYPKRPSKLCEWCEFFGKHCDGK
jgi:hypothetical protein